ncbi:sensor histidine kinase [Ciceribacter azotifigens]|uniref:sensor histidine kinase n=1 Tax=Ciceribacter azotifigens TaxID=2069303 RepID=UPI003A839737
MVHRLTWYEPQRGDEYLREFFITGLMDIGATLILQDAEGKYSCITTLPMRFRLAGSEPPTDRGLFGEDIGRRLEDMKAQLQQPGDHAEMEIDAGDDTFFEFRCRMITMANGQNNLMTVVIDRTEDRRRERLLRALLREVSHRSKNLLAIIQSIASQTARYSGSLNTFLGKFRGRLHALSQSQDLITDSSWSGAYFRDLLQQQIEKYVQDGAADLIHVTGENLLLTPNASLHVGLALHELTVNAVSHGDFVARRQRIEVSCERVREDGREAVRITWTEPLAPTDGEAPARSARFGSTVLERVVPASVNGSAVHEVRPGSVYYELTFPLDVEA